MSTEIHRYFEFELTDEFNLQIAALLSRHFPSINFFGRTYYKQLPHFRLLAFSRQKIIGHVGIDYRMMLLREAPIKVCGIIDLCVDENFQGKGIGSELLLQAERLATLGNADFMFLFSDYGKVYLKNGYKYVSNICTWLKIDQHKSLGMGHEKIENVIMVKQIGTKPWQEGELDLLGYLY